MSLLPVIMGDVQQKIEEEKIVKENENSNYNKIQGRAKKEYIHSVHTI